MSDLKDVIVVVIPSDDFDAFVGSSLIEDWQILANAVDQDVALDLSQRVAEADLINII